MKLAEALLLRADMQKKLASLKSRINENVKIQEDDTPSEAPDDLLLQANQVIDQLYGLIERIHRTNAHAYLDNKDSLLQVLVARDELAERHRLLQTAIDNAKTENERYSFREIKWTRTVDIATLQKQADEVALKLRDLNMRLQAANWQIDLLDLE